MKKIIGIVVAVIIVLGGAFGGWVVYTNHQAAVEQQKVDSTNIDDVLSNPAPATTASSNSIDDLEGLIKVQIGKQITPDNLSGFIGDFIMNKLDNHRYSLREKDSKDYLIVQFNDSEDSIVSVVKD